MGEATRGDLETSTEREGAEKGRCDRSEKHLSEQGDTA